VLLVNTAKEAVHTPPPALTLLQMLGAGLDHSLPTYEEMNRLVILLHDFFFFDSI